MMAGERQEVRVQRRPTVYGVPVDTNSARLPQSMGSAMRQKSIFDSPGGSPEVRPISLAGQAPPVWRQDRYAPPPDRPAAVARVVLGQGPGSRPGPGSLTHAEAVEILSGLDQSVRAVESHPGEGCAPRVNLTAVGVIQTKLRQFLASAREDQMYTFGPEEMATIDATLKCGAELASTRASSTPWVILGLIGVGAIVLLAS